MGIICKLIKRFYKAMIPKLWVLALIPVVECEIDLNMTLITISNLLLIFKRKNVLHQYFPNFFICLVIVLVIKISNTSHS